MVNVWVQNKHWMFISRLIINTSLKRTMFSKANSSITTVLSTLLMTNSLPNNSEVSSIIHPVFPDEDTEEQGGEQRVQSHTRESGEPGGSCPTRQQLGAVEHLKSPLSSGAVSCGPSRLVAGRVSGYRQQLRWVWTRNIREARPAAWGDSSTELRASHTVWLTTPDTGPGICMLVNEPRRLWYRWLKGHVLGSITTVCPVCAIL